MNKRIILVLISYLFIACDCEVGIQGQILSSNTGKPIEDARIEIIDKELVSSTDENGYFSLGEMTGFCYSPRVRVTYKNHKPFELELKLNSDNRIFKVKEESEYIDLDKPFYPNSENKKTSIGVIPIEKYSRNFKIQNDSVFIYLDKKDLKREIDSIKKILSSRFQ
ncbi:hypothetical protein [uncultured Christiangramia sp.]|uniref:hypothetical protein n=1 Tax=Christiangramia sp. 3-2217-3z TaxID=3417564 RepID=UPI00262AF2BB|nr:hypothetical protein [uncultured Christiangramia sp.]